ncbi:adenosylcobinamide-phosphate synthase CbiB [Paenibacillus sp.]|uniref:adenosylcobinamide-phosphate synthase CbiB n=1 Tax=Paenibacillus sp. TaxID=58172 RepID=UPI002811BC9C|nr:adenosylcobinamide-phosphate synthase CbiB [Paenibacillus sp.]
MTGLALFTWEETLWMVAAALAVDLAVGDPARLPHPVVAIGRWIRWVEARTYVEAPRERSFLFGVLLCVTTVAGSAAAAWLIVRGCLWIHPWFGYAANVWLVSTTIAWRGLADAGLRVYRPLVGGRLDEARMYTGYIVGRDTATLDEPELTRATVETVAENTVDAVLSPVVFALLGGAAGAMLYRAANTLDSMVGYRNARYLWYGKASARLDDVLNWIPARLSALLLAGAAWLRGLPGGAALRTVRRYARLHPSPNSGYPESAVAGALGVRLGGVNAYGGVESFRAYMGEPREPLRKEHIVRTVGLLHAFGGLLLGGLLCAAVLVTWGIG